MRVTGPVALVAAVLVTIVPARVDARQGEVAGRAEFLAAAAEAAELYSDRREAMADGFRRIGPDFPGMGVHWVHTSRIVAGELRGDEPSVLCYVEVDGQQTLVGLAYTLPLAGDETPPLEPFGREVWHDHSGQVTEESLLLNHPSSVTASDPGFRLSMVHVWMPHANPAGVLAQNNWTIPYLRIGLEPPPNPSADPARGLSLGSDGVEYYRELLYWAASPDASQQAAIDALLERRGAQVDQLVAGHRGPWSDGDLADLARAWTDLWRDLEEALDPAAYQRILPLRGVSD
jgi:hypothetical protein